MKFATLENIVDSNFSKALRKIRKEKRLSKKQLGYLIGKTEQQIQRYETVDIYGDKQYPPLKVFKKLCLVLQISSDELLGLHWIESDEPPDNGIIYIWQLSKDSVHWICPKCKRKNITYNDFSKNKKLLNKQEFMCEFDDCSNLFNKLNGLNDG